MGEKNGEKDEKLSCLTDQKKVIGKEKDYLKPARDEAGINTEDYTGLAISGGGIRSASFGLGVMQGLVANKIMKKIDYLSTVSGGGYIGSALTWALHKLNDQEKKTWTEPDKFPLGIKGEGSWTAEDKNRLLNYIRQHGNYLTPGEGLDGISLFGVAIRSIFISLFFYIALLSSVMFLLLKSGLLERFLLCDVIYLAPAIPFKFNFLLLFAIAILIILIVAALLYSLITGIASLITFMSKRRYQRLIGSQWRVGFAWKLILLFVIFGSIPYLSDLLYDYGKAEISSGGISALLGSLLGFFQYRKTQNPEAKKNKIVENLQLYGAVILIFYGLFMLGYGIAILISGWWLFTILLLITIIFGLCVNLNYVGFHRMYRDRLMETFMPDPGVVKDNQWGPATESDKMPLEDICGDGVRRPYHLINTNMVLVNAESSKFRGRGGDNFLLSKLFCGSCATLWQDTKYFMKQGKPERRGMTLPTAIAISGAAVNPHTGVAGKGMTRTRIISALLSLLNLRLGYWTSNPHPEREKLTSFPPNFFAPGLSSELIGSGFKEQRKSIMLSDGGHFENLALYELIRRKLKIIILSDGGADPQFRFGDLANAIERVRVDFGAIIRFEPEFGLEGLLPKTKNGLLTEKYDIAERGFALAKIEYNDNSVGLLFYLKTTLTQGLPADVYGYKSANPTFPDQSTGDQFFDETQFEAYRELGYQLTKQMLESWAIKKDLFAELLK
jgi:hypothetical protein